MTLVLQRVFDALSNGAVYASLALALTMVFRSTGVLNLAQGEMAMLTSFALARRVGAGSVAGAFAAVSYTAGGAVLYGVTSGGAAASAAWLPAVFLAADRAARGGRLAEGMLADMCPRVDAIEEHPVLVCAPSQVDCLLHNFGRLDGLNEISLARLRGDQHHVGSARRVNQ